MRLLITICARGGSKGIPGKNIKILAGLPLIAYTIRIANEFALNHQGLVSLSTDDDTIKSSALKYGLITDYNRPVELATDGAGKVSAIKHLLFYEEKKSGEKFDYVLDMDVTSPLRTLKDLEIAFNTFLASEDALTLFSVSKAARNPYFNMVERNQNGYFSLVKDKGALPLTRQSTPEVYDLNASFYFYRRIFFDEDINSVITNKSLIYLMPHICFDLDELHDFDFLEFLIEQDKLDFAL